MLEMSNYLPSLHVDFSARKFFLKKSQRVADNTMQSGPVDSAMKRIDRLFGYKMIVSFGSILK